MAVPENVKPLSVKPPGEAAVHEAPPSSANASTPTPGVGPKMAYMPVPATMKSLSVKPPGEEGVHEEALPSAPAAMPTPGVGPKMAYMPVPESMKSLSVKPPGEESVHAAPAPVPPPTAPPAAPVPGSPKVARMEVPTGGGTSLSVSGGHGKKDEKPPEDAPAAAPPPPPPQHAHPASARMAKAAPAPSQRSGSFGMGIAGAILGSLIGCGLWYYAVLNVWNIEFWALLPGIFGRIMAVLLGKMKSPKLGMSVAIIVAVVTIGMQFVVLRALDDRLLNRAATLEVDRKIAFAKEAEAAKTDVDLKSVLARDVEWSGGANLDMEATLAKFRKERLPVLVKMAKGDPSRGKLTETARARIAEDPDNHYKPSWIWIGIFVFLAIYTSNKTTRGKVD